MLLTEITRFLETLAPLHHQEDYDNSGLLVGNPNQFINKALISLDCTEDVLDEAISLGANLIISHHPIVFKGLKRFTGKNYVERVVMKAIKHDIALYAIHTNLDNMIDGVNARICDKLGLINRRILAPKSEQLLRKLVTYCPGAQANQVREALFNAGAGHIGQYSHCSFNTEGIGTFKGNAGSIPFVGSPGELHQEQEQRIETVFEAHCQAELLNGLMQAHPYEEVAYDIYTLQNQPNTVGAGMLGDLEEPVDTHEFLSSLKQTMGAGVIRHTAIIKPKVQRVAVCGGAGSFLLKDAIAAKADIFVTSDYKYHEFFDAEGKILIADIGHFESEQFTSSLLLEKLTDNFSTFAALESRVVTNPINYL